MFRNKRKRVTRHDLTAEHEIKYQKWTLNDTHGEKLCFIQLSTKNGWLAASDLFHIFTQLIKFYYTFHYHVLGVQMFGKCMNGCSFQ